MMYSKFDQFQCDFPNHISPTEPVNFYCFNSGNQGPLMGDEIIMAYFHPKKVWSELGNWGSRLEVHSDKWRFDDFVWLMIS